MRIMGSERVERGTKIYNKAKAIEREGKVKKEKGKVKRWAWCVRGASCPWHMSGLL